MKTSQVKTWQTFHDFLSSAHWPLAHARIKLTYNIRIKSVYQDNDKAWAVTDTGRIFSGDMVIGADGHRSVVRRAVAPQKPDSIFAGYMIWVAILNEQDIPEKYWPAVDAPVSMPNGIGNFLLGSVVAGADGSRKREKEDWDGHGMIIHGTIYYVNWVALMVNWCIIH